MIYEDQVLALFGEANPVSDLDTLEDLMSPRLEVVEQRTGDMTDTKLREIDPQKPIFQKQRRRGWVYGVAAAVVTLIFVGVAWAVLSNDSEPPDLPDVVDPAPTPTIVDTTPSTVPESSEPIALPNFEELLVADGRFTTYLELWDYPALDQTGTTQVEGLLRQRGTTTLFVPTDDAFAALPEGYVESLGSNTLFFLVYSGSQVKLDSTQLANESSVSTLATDVPTQLTVEVDGDGNIVLAGTATIIEADLEASNGLIHVIDSVLVPPGIEVAPLPTLEELLTADGRFTTYLELWDIYAQQGAGMALSEPGSLTLFVPTDDAFAALPSGFVDDLKATADADPRVELLLAHSSLSVRLDAFALAEETSIITGLGERVTIGVGGEVVLGNLVLDGTAAMIEADLRASNGTVHVIDSVLIPPGMIVE